MSQNLPKHENNPISLRPVDKGNWRDIAKLKVSKVQSEFVAEPLYYLALCNYGRLWQPLAIYQGEQVIGFMMWAVDTSDGSCWLGGILIDSAFQRRGFGKQAVQAAISMLAGEHNFKHFALSYQPSNSAAKNLYSQIGFKETDEWENDEVVARMILVK